MASCGETVAPEELESRTITLDAAARRRAGAPAAWLTVAFRAATPSGSPLRVRLASEGAWEIGRGATLGADGRARRIDLGDAAVSERHFLVEWMSGKQVLRDLGSKNGTLVNGERRSAHELVDGDVITAGASWLVFRIAPRPADADPAIVDAGQRLASLPPGLATLHPVLEARFDELARVAASAHPVLILGETGSGKELVARAVHLLSGRRGRFVPVSCASLPAELVASELFGVSRGAYSGATADRPGLVRAADGGTLFLDEIGELPAATQVALLRVLQEREVVPVGGTTPVKVDLRVVAATHRDLASMVRSETFREDLYARLCAVTVELLPLRARPEDLGLLVASVLREPGVKAPRAFAPEAGHLLFRHAWPRNVRELRHALLSAAAVAGPRVEARDLALESPPPATPAKVAAPRPQTVDRASLEALLERHGGNISAVARELSTSRTQVARLCERFGITPRRPRSS
jgi:pSer/pThr/pTyr-binding forkhead associated (FHA) protein